MSEVLAFGETMLLLRSAAVGQLTLHDPMIVSAAGAEATVAIGLSRFGHSVELVVHVGDDDAGHVVRSTLRGENVQVTGQVLPDRPTGLLLRTARTADLVRVAYYRRASAGSTLRAADLSAALQRTTRLVHTTGVTAALGGSAGDAVVQTLVAARGRGLTTSYDVNFRSRLTTTRDAAQVLADVLPSLDVLFLGEDELPVLAEVLGRPLPDAQSALGLAAVPELVVKCGAQGAVCDAEGALTRVGVIPVTAVDTVGAGDAFVSGYLSALLDGEEVADRLDRATRSGAFCVAGSGDWENLPRRSELDLVSRTSGSVDR